MFSRYDWSWLADWKLEQNTHSLQWQFNSYELFLKISNEISVTILIEFLINTKMFKLRKKHLDAFLHEHPSLLGPVAMVTWSGQQP